MEPKGGRRRVVVDDVRPQVDGGRYPAKRTVGDIVEVEANVFADGHDRLGASLRVHRDGDDAAREIGMEPLGNDRWHAAFIADRTGIWRFWVHGWVDTVSTWHAEILRRIEAGQDLEQELLIGARLLRRAAGRAGSDDAQTLRSMARVLRQGRLDEIMATVSSQELLDLASRYPDRNRGASTSAGYPVEVARQRARHGAWYELFPRSCSPDPGRPGTLRDIEALVPGIAELGFDVIYLPPIHPIGHTSRKGRNGATTAAVGDPGSPWAIGSEDGGHTAVHPELGTVDDVERLVKTLEAHAMELALDIAFQCSPDHPWVQEHPEWFRHRPDGSIRYAENPPKRYEDIYPFDFETKDWRALWVALRDVVLFWAERGVSIFRVDNPHTKPFGFWEWLIAEVKREHPDSVFLAEAFTRPRVMEHLAKVGFDQSYTYFAWRNTKEELAGYLTELTKGPAREFMRPNLWPNTPDILTEVLQEGGPPAFRVRLLLAATLGANYGILGPAFEHLERTPRQEDSEEYLGSEKYEIRHRDPAGGAAMRGFIAQVNRIRRANPALQYDGTLEFHAIDDPHLLAYSKRSPDGANVILVIVNLDHEHPQGGWTDLRMWEIGFRDWRSPFAALDLLSGTSFDWRGPHNFVELDPASGPGHIFRIEPAPSTPARRR
jgi:starch synthase (maltosyl-transferring)